MISPSFPRSCVGTHVRTFCVLHLNNARHYVGRAPDGTQERPNVRSHAGAWERDVSSIGKLLLTPISLRSISLPPKSHLVR
jgi:hypothetical protein